MTIAYWSQWSPSELLSMHGIESDDEVNIDSDHDENNTDLDQHCCGNCMDCLGLSWRDFM